MSDDGCCLAVLSLAEKTICDHGALLQGMLCMRFCHFRSSDSLAFGDLCTPLPCLAYFCLLIRRQYPSRGHSRYLHHHPPPTPSCGKPCGAASGQTKLGTVVLYLTRGTQTDGWCGMCPCASLACEPAFPRLSALLQLLLLMNFAYSDALICKTHWQRPLCCNFRHML